MLHSCTCGERRKNRCIVLRQTTLAVHFTFSRPSREATITRLTTIDSHSPFYCESPTFPCIISIRVLQFGGHSSSNYLLLVIQPILVTTTPHHTHQPRCYVLILCSITPLTPVSRYSEFTRSSKFLQITETSNSDLFELETLFLRLIDWILVSLVFEKGLSNDGALEVQPICVFAFWNTSTEICKSP